MPQETKEVHTHTHPHGDESSRPHSAPAYPHTHSHEHTRAVSNRLSRAIGHLEKVKQMVEDGEDCSQVLIQLAAVRSALNSAGREILKDHLSHCIVDAIENDDREAMEALNRAIDQFVK